MVPVNAEDMPFERKHFIILLLIVIAAGYSQGALLPLLSVVLEGEGISAGMNGFNSTALYIGTFATMFFIRRPVARFGYRPVIAAGLMMIAFATLAFPIWKSLAAWYVLRLIVGVGDSALHYATQLWIVTTSPPAKRGRYISLYGMSYGIGFSIGPLGLNTLRFGEIVPFGIVAAFMLVVFALLALLPETRPEAEGLESKGSSRVPFVYRAAWFALMPAFLYGYMEASLNGNFPIYGLRTGFPEAQISILLLAVGAGSLVLQLPLGALSDRIGRKPVLLACALGGGTAFLCTPLAGSSWAASALLLFAAGGFVGSFFSLGLAYAADLLPKPALPTANMIASIHFSIGSIIGPMLGGAGIEYVALPSMFVLLAGLFLLFAAAGSGFRAQNRSGSDST